MSEKIDGWERGKAENVPSYYFNGDTVSVAHDRVHVTIQMANGQTIAGTSIPLPVLRALLAEHQLHIVSEADMAVLKAVEMIPDGTLVGILTGTQSRMTGSVINTIEVESARRDAQKAGGA